MRRTLILLLALLSPIPAGAATLSLPGARWEVVAQGFKEPVQARFGPDHRLYVSEATGRVYRVEKGGGATLVVKDLHAPFGGLLFYEGKIYAAERGGISLLSDSHHSGFLDTRLRLVTGLMAEGDHPNNPLMLGPDGLLYFGMGAFTNDSIEPSDQTATLMRVKPDGTGLSVVARGLRNPYGILFAGGQAYVTDQGATPPDVAQAPDEINQVPLATPGNGKLPFYGHPGVYGTPPAGSDSVAPWLLLPPHSGASALIAVTGKAFPALTGKWLVALAGDPMFPGGGQRVSVIDPATRAVTPLVTGLSRPVDLMQDETGAIYVTDRGTGSVSRIVPGPQAPATKRVK